MQIWTDAWIPKEIAEKVGTADKGYGIVRGSDDALEFSAS
jgi:hypothetical protein